jgi:hypothetical protein
MKKMMDDQRVKQNENVGFIQAAIKNNLRSQLTDPDVDSDYEKLMETAEKQLGEQQNPEDENQAKSEELINTKITDQDIPGISNNKASVSVSVA